MLAADDYGDDFIRFVFDRSPPRLSNSFDYRDRYGKFTRQCDFFFD